MKRHPVFMDQKTNVVQMAIFLKAIYRLNTNLIKNSSWPFCRNVQADPDPYVHTRDPE